MSLGIQPSQAARLAVVAGVFSLLVSVFLALNPVGERVTDAHESQAIKELKTELAERLTDDALKARVRELDLVQRQEILRREKLTKRGTWLLIGGLALFVWSLRRASRSWKTLPAPLPISASALTGLHGQMSAQGRRAVFVIAVALGATTVFLSLGAPEIPLGEEDAGASGAVSDAPPSPEEIRRNWPGFRGPGGLGVAASAEAPTTWDGVSGAGVLWKTPVPLPGENSPLVWGERVFLTGATERERAVFAYDANTGKLLWRAPVSRVRGSPARAPSVSEDTGHAASTGVTDGRYVCAIFANGDIACFDMQGRRVWARNIGVPDNVYGHAASLVVHEALVFVQYDQGHGEPEETSKVLALELRNGETVWERSRNTPTNWTSPIVVPGGESQQLVICGVPWVVAYDALTGEELWRVECLSGEIAPTPVFADGLLYVITPNEILTAIRLGGRGDVTETHIAWQAEDGVPDMSSPLVSEGLLFLVDSMGLLTCYDAQEGEKLWEHDLETDFRSSPTLVGERIYLLSDEGVTMIIAAKREFELLGTAKLGERSASSPAFVGRRIFTRGEKHLFCVGPQ